MDNIWCGLFTNKLAFFKKKKEKNLVFQFVYKAAACCFHYFIKSTWSHPSKQQH